MFQVLEGAFCQKMQSDGFWDLGLDLDLELELELDLERPGGRIAPGVRC